MTAPGNSSKRPYVVDCVPGSYAWCACGNTKKRPFCDGSHAGTGVVPKIEEITEAKKVAWCGCRLSKKGVYCDGSHKDLPS